MHQGQVVSIRHKMMQIVGVMMRLMRMLMKKMMPIAGASIWLMKMRTLTRLWKMSMRSMRKVLDCEHRCYGHDGYCYYYC